MQAVIEENLYEIEPAVKLILDRVMFENAQLKREIKRLEGAADCEDTSAKHECWIEKNDWIACPHCNHEILDDFYTKRFHYIACPYCGREVEKVEW